MPGDFAGADSFQGGPFGFGGYRQLANPKEREEIVDPAQQMKKQVRGPLDKEREPAQPLEPILEREASDVLYRDMPGNTPMNSLSSPENHIPLDPASVPNGEQDNNMSSVTATTLIPTPKLQKFGYKESLNKWDETSGENIKPVTQNAQLVALVKPKNFLSQKELDPMSGFNRLEDDDDVNTRPGNMANLSAPKKFIPEPAPVYEEQKMKAKNSKKFNELEDKENFVPSDKAKKKVDKAETFSTPDSKTSENPNTQKLQPYKGDENVFINPEDFSFLVENLTNKIFEKLLKKLKNRKEVK